METICRTFLNIQCLFFFFLNSWKGSLCSCLILFQIWISWGENFKETIILQEIWKPFLYVNALVWYVFVKVLTSQSFALLTMEMMHWSKFRREKGEPEGCILHWWNERGKYCTRLPAHWDSELFWIATNDQGKNLSVSGMH